jgi:hypothetical protein
MMPGTSSRTDFPRGLSAPFRASLNDFYRLHERCIVLRHGVRDVAEWREWKLYRPSHFVYAFFTFNTLYNVNWAESAERSRVWEWRGKIDSDLGKRIYESEEEKINSLVAFIQGEIGENTPRLVAAYLNRCLTLFLPAQVDAVESLPPPNR